jgi:hypothetical protein
MFKIALPAVLPTMTWLVSVAAEVTLAPVVTVTVPPLTVVAPV